MSENRNWEELTLQYTKSGGKGSGGYYRVTVPAGFQFGENVYDESKEDHIQIAEMGDHLVIRPIEEPNYDAAAQPFDDRMEKLVAREQEYVRSFVRNVIQSHYIAGVDSVNAAPPREWDDRLRNTFESAIKDIDQEIQSGYLSFDREELEFRVEKELKFDEYVASVRKFIDQHLIRILEHTGSDRVFREDRAANIDRREKVLDTEWSLTTRHVFNRFLEMDRPSFPKGFCEIYVGKYLERLVDFSQELVEELVDFEDDFEDYPELLGWLKGFLRSVFVEGEESPDKFDGEIEKYAEKSYKLDITNADFRRQVDRYRNRRDVLRSVDDELILDQMSDGFRDRDPTAPMALGRRFERIRLLTEMIVRIPRSITLVGHLSRNIHEVHSPANG